VKNIDQRLGPHRRHVLHQEPRYQQAEEQLEMKGLRCGRGREDRHNGEKDQLSFDESQVERHDSTDDGSGQDGPEYFAQQSE
jgi:hypothetical protein